MSHARGALAGLARVIVVASLLCAVAASGVFAQGPSSSAGRVSRGIDEMVRPLPEKLPDDTQRLLQEHLTTTGIVEAGGHLPRALELASDREVSVIIELSQEPVAVLATRSRAAGQAVAQDALDQHRRIVAQAQDNVMAMATQLGAREISRYDTVYNGIQVRVATASLAALAEIPWVVGVRRAPVHMPALDQSVPIIGATDLGVDLGIYGDGVVIAIIDTGIDYTHAALGGSGNPAEYAQNDPDIVESGTFATAKVIGGHDLAGSNYDAGSTDPDEYIPVPDQDPLDEWGHGTHVASIAAGIGSASVAPGVAPEASLMAYKVFGTSGSSSL